ncbi:MAG TPA: response regulator [Terriglobia bacterium]|nr:response regulator [Terriglobia bacterium]
MHTETPDVIEFSSRFNNPAAWENPAQKHIARSETPGRGQKILVVDDSLAWLRLAGEILTACGYQVQTCEDPRDALSLLKQNPEQIDLVITDLQMPCLDGIALAAELRKINAALPVVLTSAAMFHLPSEKLQRLGIRDFLTKPWDRERLFSVLRQVLPNTRSEESR